MMKINVKLSFLKQSLLKQITFFVGWGSCIQHRTFHQCDNFSLCNGTFSACPSMFPTRSVLGSPYPLELIGERERKRYRINFFSSFCQKVLWNSQVLEQHVLLSWEFLWKAFVRTCVLRPSYALHLPGEVCNSQGVTFYRGELQGVCCVQLAEKRVSRISQMVGIPTHFCNEQISCRKPGKLPRKVSHRLHLCNFSNSMKQFINLC